MLTADAGHHELIEKLIDLGASVRAEDSQGRTALSRACEAGHVRAAKALMDRGADANHRDNHGLTCAQLAQSFDQRQVLRLLNPTEISDKELHQLLSDAGFTQQRAKCQQNLADWLQEVARVLTQDRRQMTGSYAEGWANSLVQVNGRTAADSDIDWTVLVAGQKFHLEGGCDRRYRICEVETPLQVTEGHAQVTVGSQPAVAATACGVRPAQDTCHAIDCCSSFCEDRIEKLLRNNLDHVHLVRATRPSSTNELRVSFSFQEKRIMRQLSTVQGQLFTFIKFIFKRHLPLTLDTPGLKTYHAKTLLFFMLERHGTDPETEAWQPHNLIALLNESLDMMLSFIDSSSSPDECMPHFFMPDAPLYFKNAGIGGDFDNTKARVRDRLREMRSDIGGVVEQLRRLVRPLQSEKFYFHPFTLLPLTAPPAVTKIMEGRDKFADVYSVVHQCVSGLQSESSDRDTLMRQLSLLHELQWCKCAALCLIAMAHLKFGESEEAEKLAMELQIHQVVLCSQPDCRSLSPSHLYVNFRCLSWSLQAELLRNRAPAIAFDHWIEQLLGDPDLEELLTLAHYSDCREHVELSLQQMEMIEKERRVAMETQDEEKIGWVRQKLERLKKLTECPLPTPEDERSKLKSSKWRRNSEEADQTQASHGCFEQFKQLLLLLLKLKAWRLAAICVPIALAASALYVMPMIAKTLQRGGFGTSRDGSDHLLFYGGSDLAASKAKVLVDRSSFPAEAAAATSIVKNEGGNSNWIEECASETDCRERLMFDENDDAIVALIRYSKTPDKSRSVLECPKLKGPKVDIRCAFLYKVMVLSMQKTLGAETFKEMQIYELFDKRSNNSSKVERYDNKNTKSWPNSACANWIKTGLFQQIASQSVPVSVSLSAIGLNFYLLISTVSCIRMIKSNGFLQQLFRSGLSVSAYWLVIWLVTALECLFFAGRFHSIERAEVLRSFSGLRHGRLFIFFTLFCLNLAAFMLLMELLLPPQMLVSIVTIVMSIGILVASFNAAMVFVYHRTTPFMPDFWCPKGHKDRSDSAPSEGPEEKLESHIEPVMELPPIIAVKAVTKTYRNCCLCCQDATAVLKNLSCTIYRGQITALIGHNGAGKSTLIKVLTGEELPDEGTAHIGGCLVTNPLIRLSLRGRIGTCPQFDALCDSLTVMECIRVTLISKAASDTSHLERARGMLQRLGLGDKEDVLSCNLSGGQKRKVSTILALMGDPDVVFLDEPTSGLDPVSRRQLWQLLQEEKSARSIILCTQFMDEADILADRKIFLCGGKIVCVGSSMFLKRAFGCSFTLNVSLKSKSGAESLLAKLKQVRLKSQDDTELQLEVPAFELGCFDQGGSGSGDQQRSRDIRTQGEKNDRPKGPSMDILIRPAAPRIDSNGLNEIRIACVSDGKANSISKKDCKSLVIPYESKAMAPPPIVITKSPSQSIKDFMSQRSTRDQLYNHQKDMKTGRIPTYAVFYASPWLKNASNKDRSKSAGRTVGIFWNGRIQKHHRCCSPRAGQQHTTVVKTGLQLPVFYLVFSMLSVSYLSDPIEDMSSRVRSYLIATGMTHLAYWVNTFLMHWVQYAICYVIAVGLLMISDTFRGTYLVLAAFLPVFLLGTVSNLLTIYTIAVLTKTKNTLVSTGCILAAVFLPVAMMLINSYSVIMKVLIWTVPPAAPLGLVVSCANFYFLKLAYYQIKDGSELPGMIESLWTNSGIFHSLIAMPAVCHRGAQTKPDQLDSDMEDGAKKEAERVLAAPRSSNNVLEVRQLQKIYPKQSPRCARRHLRSDGGEIFGLLGVNGAGKSTSMSVIVGEEAATEGVCEVRVQDGAWLSGREGSTIGAIGYCPQHSPLFSSITVAEHIRFYADIRGLDSIEAEQQTTRLMQSLGLSQHSDKQAGQLSGGNKRRLCLAIALLGDPALIVIDEASTGVDPENKRFIWGAIRRMVHKQRSVMVTTHSMEEVEALCSRVGIMNKGRMISVGTVQNLLSRHATETRTPDCWSCAGSGDWSEIKQKRLVIKNSVSEQFKGAQTQDDLGLGLVMQFSVPKS
uniref:ANK_REP_REGION domain-containing protein n=1 Tax=Macrostomum lignano TaxID=282301 RepID=A0A1I8FSU9_9PLAT